jgi:hypothetical protein
MKAEVTKTTKERYTFTCDEIVKALNQAYRVNISSNDVIDISCSSNGKRLSTLTFVRNEEHTYDPTLQRGGPNDL